MIRYTQLVTFSCSSEGCFTPPVEHRATFYINEDGRPHLSFKRTDLPKGWRATRWVPGIIQPPNEPKRMPELFLTCPACMPPGMRAETP